MANSNFSFYFLSVINRSKQLLVVLPGLRKDEKEGEGKKDRLTKYEIKKEGDKEGR